MLRADEGPGGQNDDGPEEARHGHALVHRRHGRAVHVLLLERDEYCHREDSEVSESMERVSSGVRSCAGTKRYRSGGRERRRIAPRNDARGLVEGMAGSLEARETIHMGGSSEEPALTVLTYPAFT